MPDGTWVYQTSRPFVTQGTTIKFLITGSVASRSVVDRYYQRHPQDFIHLSTLSLTAEEVRSQFPEYFI